jgi:hypothetical protein
VAQSKKKESARILFFYSDIHTGFDPEPVFPKGPGARTRREPAEAAWREVAGSHRPEGESCVAQKKPNPFGFGFFT